MAPGVVFVFVFGGSNVHDDAGRHERSRDRTRIRLRTRIPRIRSYFLSVELVAAGAGVDAGASDEDDFASLLDPLSVLVFSDPVFSEPDWFFFA